MSWRRSATASASWSWCFAVSEFTATTLTATLPVLLRRTRESVIALMRMCGKSSSSPISSARHLRWLVHAQACSRHRSKTRSAPSGSIVSGGSRNFFKAVLAGWLMALMVWTLPGAGSARLFVIILLTSAVSLGHFPHIVAGATDAASARVLRPREP